MERPSHIPQSTLQPPPPPAFQSPGGFDLENKISPSILLIIIILAIIFFVSGLLHLLVRLLLRPNNRHPDEAESDVTALQGQLQQLFHLHDAGVDQSYIDTLPVFHYKSIIGVKDPFDCAVCLCEFEPEDSLRLLPGCSHAFHLDCIDTWLLSHSTCPLCRSSLLSDFFSSAPVVCIVESDSETATEAHGVDRELGELGSSRIEIPRKSCEISMKESESGEKIVSVRLGKLRNVDGAGESSSTSSNNNNGNSRRCFSMGSFAYVMDETTSLQVPIRTPAAITKKQSSGFPPLKPGHRSAVSEYGSDSRREYNVSNRGDTRGKGESFSVSKILFRSGEMKNGDSSNRAFSFRFRLGGSGRVDGGGTSVENWWENGGSEMGWNDEETRSVESHQSMRTTSGRTVLWLMARHQNKMLIL